MRRSPSLAVLVALVMLVMLLTGAVAWLVDQPTFQLEPSRLFGAI